MPNFCMVVGCSKNSAKNYDLKFFRIPSTRTKGSQKECDILKERRERWISALKREDLSESKILNGRICSLHFHTGKPTDFKDIDNPDWVPSKDMGYLSNFKAKGTKRFERKQNRQEKIKQSSLSLPSTSQVAEVPMDEIEVAPSYLELKEALQVANNEIKHLKFQLQYYKLEEEYFKSNVEYAKYFSGFPEFATFKTILEEIEPYLNNISKVSKFHQLLLTVMKLRFNFQFTYLGHIFQCHRTTATRIFEKVIHVLYMRLKGFIRWPTREELQTNMPVDFKKVFGLKTTVIVDCFEVFIEKPPNLEASSRTWSNYKHHHTIKFLIGITPQGMISFISNAYGGRASDKFITEDSGFLNNLSPHDCVITDRGFTIDDSVRMYNVEVKYPTFLKGKKQLNAVDAESTRKLASVRIHIERVIGLLKQKYKIFHSVFPISQLKKKDNEYALIDEAVTVCSAFVNFCPGIVPIEEFTII